MPALSIRELALVAVTVLAGPSNGHAQDPAPAGEPSPVVAAPPIAGAWAVGTQVIGLRSRSNGNTKMMTGTVVENAGKRLVVRMNDYHVWDYVFEKTPKGFALVAQVKQDRRAGTLSDFGSKLVLNDGCMSGSYSWLLDGKQRVQGTLDLRAVGPAEPGKDPVLDRWCPGAGIDGKRGDAQLTGSVLRHDAKTLVLAVTESFSDEQGKKHNLSFTYEFTRVRSGGGAVGYRLCNQEPLDPGPKPGHRFAFEGEVKLRGGTLIGTIRFKNFPNKPVQHENLLELELREQVQSEKRVQ